MDNRLIVPARSIQFYGPMGLVRFSKPDTTSSWYRCDACMALMPPGNIDKHEWEHSRLWDGYYEQPWGDSG